MENRILEIVKLLMNRLQENDDQTVSFSEISTDLRGLGYSDVEISFAYGWIIDQLQIGSDKLYTSFPSNTESTRIFTPTERAMFTPEALVLLSRLVSMRILGVGELEEVIDKVVAGNRFPVSTDQLKLIVVMVGDGGSPSEIQAMIPDDDIDAFTTIN